MSRTATLYEHVYQVKFAEESLQKLEGIWPYPFKLFKGSFPQILLGRFLNTLSHKLGKNEYIEFGLHE